MKILSFFLAQACPKNLLLFLMCVLKSNLLVGQDFAPIGSTWYYDHTFFFGNNKNDYTKIVTIGDTILNGKSCSILFIENAAINLSDFPDTVYVRFDEGKVYRYFQQQDIWGLQYDFNALAGDTLICYGSYYAIFDSFKVRIDTIGITSINGVSLRTQYYRSLSGDWDYTQKVIEGIGGQNFLFTSWTLAENTNNGLRCYEDDTIGYYNTGIVEECDAILYIGIDQLNSAKQVTVYPTLLIDRLSIVNPTRSRVQLYLFNDINCLVAQSELAPFENKVIECSMLQPGFYIAKIVAGNSIQVTKILKF